MDVATISAHSLTEKGSLNITFIYESIYTQIYTSLYVL